MIGQLIADRYQVVEVLGSGKMANTYLTLDLCAGDRTKCVIKQFVPSHSDAKLQAAQRQLFAEEVASLKTLGAHAQIPQHLDDFEHQEKHYLIQEFIDGYPLTAELSLGKRWQASQVIQFLQDMLSLLVFVHSQGVIHRDIKPSNIIRRRSDGRLVLIDFGAAQRIATQQALFAKESRTNFIVGTLGYMPVEQAQGKAQLNSDVYSLGMMAIQALTGQFPRQLPEDKNGEWIWRSHTTVSDELATVLAKMVRCRPGQRFQSATEALEAVQALRPIASMVEGTVRRTDGLVGASWGGGARDMRRAREAEGVWSKQGCLSGVATCQLFLNPKRFTIPVVDSGSLLDTAPTEIMPSNRTCKTSSYEIAAISPWLHRVVWRCPLRVLMGAAAIVLATALPGIADRVHIKATGGQSQKLFNPQNLQHVGRYDDCYNSPVCLKEIGNRGQGIENRE